MTLVKWNHRPAANYRSTFPKWVDDFFGRDMNELFHHETSSMPRVNIKEDDNGFSLEVAAPGLGKDDFNISLKENRLTVAAKKETRSEEANEGKYYRKEFGYTSFSRSFTLPKTVDIDNIAANYENGVLHLTLPKLEKEQVDNTRTIQIG